MLDRIRNEPTLVTGLIRAVLLCLVAFGFKLSPAQIAAVMLVAGCALSLVARSKVVPVRKVDPLSISDGKRPRGEGGAVSVATVCLVVIAAVLLLSWLGLHGHVG